MSDPVFREGDRLLLPVTVVPSNCVGGFVRVAYANGAAFTIPASLLVRESEVRARALEEAAGLADRFVKVRGDNGYPPGVAGRLARYIRALIEKPEGERS